MKLQTIVLSGVNFFEGGPLSLMKDCLKALAAQNTDQHLRIIALVSRKELFQDLELGNVELIEFPESRKSYRNRLTLEYRKFASFATSNNVDLWISLHDITPSLPRSCRQVVYFHNPAPFYRISLREFRLDLTIGFFSLLYKYLYRINVHRNEFVIVQQQWLRDKVVSMFGLDAKRVIVAHPVTTAVQSIEKTVAQNDVKLFFFPTFPRVFKNIEILGEAARLLTASGIEKFRILVTISGDENKYAADLRARFADVPQLQLIGKQDRRGVFEIYQKADAMIFPSKLETWGLPISEFKSTGKPILLADLPYAHETLSDYHSAYFFDPKSPEMLANAMRKMIQGENIFQKHTQPPIAAPYASNWNELFDLILRD